MNQQLNAEDGEMPTTCPVLTTQMADEICHPQVADLLLFLAARQRGARGIRGDVRFACAWHGVCRGLRHSAGWPCGLMVISKVCVVA